MKKLKTYSQKDIYMGIAAIILILLYILYKFVLNEYILIIVIYVGIHVGIGALIRKYIFRSEEICKSSIYDFILALTLITSFVSTPMDLRFKIESLPNLIVILIIFPILYSYFKKEIIYTGDKNFQIVKDFGFSYFLIIATVFSIFITEYIIDKF